MFSTYTKYKYKFKTGLKKKIIVHDYDNLKLKISDLKDNINTLTITNIKWKSKLGQNLLRIIFLAKKSVQMFLRKAGQPLEIVVDKEILSWANIIEN